MAEGREIKGGEESITAAGAKLSATRPDTAVPPASVGCLHTRERTPQLLANSLGTFPNVCRGQVLGDATRPGPAWLRRAFRLRLAQRLLPLAVSCPLWTRAVPSPH